MPDPFVGAPAAPLSVSVDGDLLEMLQEGAKARSSPPSPAPQTVPIEEETSLQVSTEENTAEHEHHAAQTKESYEPGLTAHTLPLPMTGPTASRSLTGFLSNTQRPLEVQRPIDPRPDPVAADHKQPSESLSALLKSVHGRRLQAEEIHESEARAETKSSKEGAAAEAVPEAASEPISGQSAGPTAGPISGLAAAAELPISRPASAGPTSSGAVSFGSPAFVSRTATRQFIPVEDNAPAAPRAETSLTQMPRLAKVVNEETEEEVLPAASRSKWIPLSIAGGAILLAALTASFLANRNASRESSSPASAVVTAGPAIPVESTSPLELRVESREKSLIGIRWNSGAMAVTNAKQGRLVIMERDQQPRVVELQPAQLRIGHLYYETPADRVEFRLEITDMGGSTTQESFLALSPTPATPANALPTGGKAPGAPTSSPSTPTAPGSNGSQIVPRAQATPGQLINPAATTALSPAPIAATSGKPGARVFQTPQRDQVRAVYLEPPSESLGASPLPVTLGQQQANLAPVPPPIAAPPVAASSTPTAATPTPAPTQAASGAIRISSTLQAANLIKRVDPVYPVIAKQSRISGVVRFNATIAKDGSIRNLQVLNGHPMLTPAAAGAVKQWIYRPTMLNGQPQEVVTQIEVNFTLK